MNWPNRDGYTSYLSLEEVFDPAFYENVAGVIFGKIKEQIGRPFYSGHRSTDIENLDLLLSTPHYKAPEKPVRNSWSFSRGSSHTSDAIKGNLSNYFFGVTSSYYICKDFSRDLFSDMLESEDVRLTLLNALEQGVFNLSTPHQYTNPEGNGTHFMMEPLLHYDIDQEKFVLYNNGIEAIIPIDFLRNAPIDFVVRDGSTKFVKNKDSQAYVLDQMLNGQYRVLPYCMITRHTSCLDAMHTLAEEVRYCKELTESAREQLNNVLADEAVSYYNTFLKNVTYRSFEDVTKSISEAFNVIFRTVCYNDWDERGREIMDVSARFTLEKKVVFKVNRNEEAEK